MNPSLPKALLSAIAIVSLTTSAFAVTQKPQPRLASPINNTSRATLPGSQPLRVHQARDLGAVDGSTQLQSMSIVFNRTAAQQADLDALLVAQQNPASPQFHQWLTPAEFGARFGMADSDISKVETWLQSQGFTVLSVSPSRDRISFSGSAAAVANAFGAPLHHYSLDGQTHIAPSADISLPAALSGVVQDVTNLNDFRPVPRVRRGSVRPSFTSSQSGNHFLTPLDVATIYDIAPAYNAGFNGSGQTIAIVGQSAVVSGDITNFQTALGQTAKAPTLTLVPNTGSSEVFNGDESESDLDLEYTTGIAPGATIDFVYVGNNQNSTVFDALTYAIQNDVAPIINISYGECEPGLTQPSYTTYNATLQQAASQGQTIVSASGDSGSTDCFGEQGIATNVQTALAVDFPASSQYVTGVGGTEFPAADVITGNNTYFQSSTSADIVSSALSYIPEGVWNDNSASAVAQYGLSAGGGGISIFTTPAPSWQNTSVPGISSTPTARLVPDVAFDASPNNAPYAYCSSDSTAWATGQAGSCTSGLRDSVSQDLTVAGGTSFAAPIFSGMVAILNQAKGYASQGLVNPTLYSLASNATTYASAFHDITTGSNSCAGLASTYCSTAGAASYSAATGYDEASGLGSIDFYNLLSAWPHSGGTSLPPSFALSATSVSVTSGSSTSSTVTITPANGYTGTINWSVAPTTLPSACYSIAATKITSSSPATATISIQTGSSTCASGYTPLTQAGSGSSASLRTPSSPLHSGSTPARRTSLAAFGLLSLAALGLVSRRRARRLPMLLALVLFATIGTFGLSGCGGSSASNTGGGGGGSTNPTTTAYTVTLIGADSASTAITAKATFTVTLTTTT
jgi:subtilase family serine protease